MSELTPERSIGEPPVHVRASRIAFECAWYRVRQDEVTWPDGSPGQYNVVEAAPCVFVVPVTAAGEVILIHQYRYPTGVWTWEVPAGTIRPGQTPQLAAQTELLEEVGGYSDNWRYLGHGYTANGRCNELAHFFLAAGVTLGANAPEPTEILTVHPTPVARALAMARSSEIADAPSALALLLAEPYLRSQG